MKADEDGNSFFAEVLRIASSDYIPNEADVLRARTKTTGIYETRFTMGQLSIQYDATPFHFSRSRLTFPLACSTSVAKGARERSGFIALKMSHLSSSVSH